MPFVGPNYERMKSDRNIGVLLAPTGNATGIDEIFEPSEAELTPGGASGVQNAAQSISWNDFDFGIQDSETTTDPSLADDSTYEDFGQRNYGGGISFYYPKEYDDNSNNHSIIYDMTDEPWTLLDVVMRVDGDKNNVTEAYEDGDFVHVARTLTDGEANTLSGSDALRRTVQFLPQGGVAVYTIVGDHVLTAIEPTAWTAGSTGRLRVTVQDRDYTSALSFSSSDPDVVSIGRGGFFEVTGASSDTATITIEDEGAGTTTTVTVTVV